MKKKYLEKDINLQTKTENYWWSKIIIAIIYNNGVPKIINFLGNTQNRTI